MKLVLAILVVSASLFFLACGGSPALTCQTTSCQSGALTYQTCVNVNGTATYKFGGMSCDCPTSNTAQCQACAASVAAFCGGGGGGGSGGAGGGGGGGGGATACTYTMSGAATNSGSCMMFAAYEASKSEVDVSLTTSNGQPTFGAGLVGQTTLTTGTFTLADAPEAGASYLEGTTSLWAMCNNNNCTDGAGNTVPNQGTFTLTISDPGPVSNGILWQTPHGTLSATLPADPNTTASGVVTLDVTF